MKATQHEMDKHAADYADEFAKPDQARHQMSDDEAFGLSEPEGGAAPEGSAAEEAAESPAEEAAEQAQGQGDAADAGASPDAGAGDAPAADAAADAAPADAAPSGADAEQRLKSWEGRLKARQAELDAREAAMSDSSVNDQQASMPLDGEGGEGGDGGADEANESGGDPASVLAEDFGPDFVDQLTKLIKQVTQDCVGGVSSQVDQVISALQDDRRQRHFDTIAGTHADFMEIVDSPAFESWKAAQPDQAALQKVIDSGSARQIIDMLTQFKDSNKPAGSADNADNPDYADALDNAEGVRSSGLSLPKEPVADDDFAKAWNES